MDVIWIGMLEHGNWNILKLTWIEWNLFTSPFPPIAFPCLMASHGRKIMIDREERTFPMTFNPLDPHFAELGKADWNFKWSVFSAFNSSISIECDAILCCEHNESAFVLAAVIVKLQCVRFHSFSLSLSKHKLGFYFWCTNIGFFIEAESNRWFISAREKCIL